MAVAVSIFSEIFAGIMENAENGRSVKETHRREDGLLYCDVCGEPLETEMPEEIKALFPGKKTRPRMCRCDREKADAEERIEKEQLAKNRIDAIRKDGLYSSLYESCTFDHDDRRDERASRIARNYVSHFREYSEGNAGMMFWGGVGTGKSYLAACIANALIDRNYTVIMAPLQDIVADMTANYNANRDSILDRVETCDLLILDDLGVERGTDYMYEHVYDLINTRYLAKKPMIVTTNLSPQQLESDPDIRKVRIYDRIKENCQPIKVAGESRRKGIAKGKAELFRRLLEAGEEDE